MKKLKIGIVGCGVIGSEIAGACVTVLKEKTELAALFDIDRRKAETLKRSVKKGIVADSMDELFQKSDLIVEAAHASASRGILEKAVDASKDIMLMSVGGLIESRDLLDRAEKKGIRVYLPSGAICGIDAIKAAKISGINSVTLTTRKPAKGLLGAPYLKEKNIDIEAIKGETVVFEGSAREAVEGFPKNINVASLLSLVGKGAEETTVRIITSPEYTKNVHEIEMVGEFGRISTRTENVPSEKNPKTSKLAILSAIATLGGMAENVKLGT